MIQTNFAERYSKLNDAELKFLHRDRESLVDQAVFALEAELLKRDLRFCEPCMESGRAYETLGGVVVTQKNIRVPICCARCLAVGELFKVHIQSPITKFRYWIVFSQTITHSYGFFFCPNCKDLPSGVTDGSIGVQIARLPRGRHDLFQFANDAYMGIFLRANE